MCLPAFWPRCQSKVAPLCPWAHPRWSSSTGKQLSENEMQIKRTASGRIEMHREMGKKGAVCFEMMQPLRSVSACSATVSPPFVQTCSLNWGFSWGE